MDEFEEFGLVEDLNAVLRVLPEGFEMAPVVLSATFTTGRSLVASYEGDGEPT